MGVEEHEAAAGVGPADGLGEGAFGLAAAGFAHADFEEGFVGVGGDQAAAAVGAVVDALQQ